MKIQVTFEMDEDDENADPDHEMGVTNECYQHLMRVIPGYDMEVWRLPDDGS
jgi:hypothetical protein